jgi:hypothetical protein
LVFGTLTYLFSLIGRKKPVTEPEAVQEAEPTAEQDSAETGAVPTGSVSNGLVTGAVPGNTTINVIVGTPNAAAGSPVGVGTVTAAAPPIVYAAPLGGESSHGNESTAPEEPDDSDDFYDGGKLPITAEKLIRFARTYLPGAAVVPPKRAALPTCLKGAGRKTFAMIYERPEGLLLKVKLPPAYVARIIFDHQHIARSAFPYGNSWHDVPVDSSYRDAQPLFRILKRAKAFSDAALLEV